MTAPVILVGTVADGSVRPVTVGQDGGFASSGFNPTGTVSLSVTSTTARVALPATGRKVMIRNYGPNRVFVKRGTGTATAAATDYPVEAYTIDTLTRDLTTETYIAAICANSGETATLSINCGEGGT